MKYCLRAAALIATLTAVLGAGGLASSAAAGQSPLPPQPPEAVERTEPPQSPPDMNQFRFGRPVLRVGQDYTLRADDVVGEVRSVFGDVVIEGRVQGEALAVLGSVHLASTAVIEGSLLVIGGSATIEAGAAVHRDLVVVGGTLTAPADFSPEGEHVVVGSAGIGNALQGVVPWLTRGLLWGRLIVPDLGWIWGFVAIVFLIYVVLNAVFERPVRACADTIVVKPLSAFMLGLLVLVLTIPALAILAASVIGLAVVPFAICALFAGAIVGKAGVARAIGRGFVRETETDSRFQGFRSLLIGSVVLCLAYMVPVVGLVTWALTGVLGLGAAAVAFRVALRREHPARVRVAAPVPAPEPRPSMAPQAAAAGAGVPLDLPSLDGPPLDGPPPGGPPTPPPPGGDFALYPRATFLDRVAAFALDALLVAIAVQLLDMSRHDGWFPLLLLAYHIAFWAWKGTTLGGIVCGLRVVRTQGTELRFVDALVRGLGSVFSIAALGIGCFWMLQDAERQMWHDKIAGTLVVKVPRDLVLP